MNGTFKVVTGYATKISLEVVEIEGRGLGRRGHPLKAQRALEEAPAQVKGANKRCLPPTNNGRQAACLPIVRATAHRVVSTLESCGAHHCL